MFNSGTWQSHAEYRINFRNLTASFSSDLRMQLWNQYAVVKQKMFSLNLDYLIGYIPSLYSNTGRPSKNQAQILRSIVLFCFLFGKTDASYSLTSWVNIVLPSNPLFIALVGCRGVDDLPPLGSYYDFMNRLWKENRLKYSRFSLFPPGKNGKKPKKVIGPDGKLVEPEPDKNSTRLLEQKIISGMPLSSNPESRLQDIFYLTAVLPSLKCRLISNECLTLSGDGTPVAVHATPFGRTQKGCLHPGDCKEAQNCWRHFSDPDADWGYDSHEKDYYFGRTLYMISCRNNDHKVEVPVLMKFASAKRHDSILFFHAVDELGRHMPGLCPKNFCLDSAHDNYPTYRILERWDINALIDMNMRSSKSVDLPDGFTLNKQSHPVCPAGFEMSPWGYDITKEAHKYRCPYACGYVKHCPCRESCSTSSYGRTIHLKRKDDLRYFPRIARDSAEFKNIYSERTASERVNNRVLNNYHLLDLKIRGTDHYSFWTMAIGICIHLDARAKAKLL